ncbi:hypothetical protein [Methanoregula sp.]|uniref:hypothetical protein n=1 Tax=Methanoregula sp. TaxID=2052170 RepID=UPI00236EEB67|nr:hypothetical protein [Methanoregula sp.]MDD1687249.1 hypothetical protein [Methanoregula sp.]
MAVKKFPERIQKNPGYFFTGNQAQNVSSGSSRCCEIVATGMVRPGDFRRMRGNPEIFKEIPGRNGLNAKNPDTFLLLPTRS